MAVSFIHVPRAMNAIADWAGNVSRVVQHGVELTQLVTNLKPGEKPRYTAAEAAAKITPPLQGMVTHLPGRTPRPDHPVCDVCGYRVTWRVGFHCWGCGHYYHRQCLGFNEVSGGVWICYCCRDKAKDTCTRDLVLDRDLMYTVC